MPRFNANAPLGLKDNRRYEPQAADFCVAGGTCRDSANRPGPCSRRRGAQAAHRHPVRHRETVRGLRIDATNVANAIYMAIELNRRTLLIAARLPAAEKVATQDRHRRRGCSPVVSLITANPWRSAGTL